MVWVCKVVSDLKMVSDLKGVSDLQVVSGCVFVCLRATKKFVHEALTRHTSTFIAITTRKTDSFLVLLININY